MKLTNNYLRFISIVILSGILFSCTACSSSTSSEDYVVSDFGEDNSIHQKSRGQDEDNSETNLHNSQEDIYEPWEKDGKTPDQYTWEEFWALSEPERNAFVD